MQGIFSFFSVCPKTAALKHSLRFGFFVFVIFPDNSPVILAYDP